MGKKNKKKKVSAFGKPRVSVCTPTYNRRDYIPMLIKNYLAQDYPRELLEWIVVDDGQDCLEDLFKDVPTVKYFYQKEKMKLGRKRNYMNEKATGDIIVYMDDDDYYPPNRVSHAVNKLLSKPEALAAGASLMHVYFTDTKKIYEFGPYGPNHATANTFAFKKQLLEQTKFEDHVEMSEEKAFLKNYTIPFVQLDARKSIVCFSHETNTFDKRKLLDNPHPDYVKETKLKLSNFIKDKSVARFYSNK